MDLLDTHIFGRIGEEGFDRLTAAFFRRVPLDDILGKIYPEHDLAGAEQRLRDFLIGRFGGPMRYVEQRGHPRLRMRHAPFQITQAVRDRWMLRMEEAMREVAFPADVDAMLRLFFDSSATFMMNAG